MSKQINIRLDKAVVKDLEELAREQNLDRAALVKKVILDGLANERMKFAIQRYVMQEISLERAAEIAKVPVHEMIAVTRNVGIGSTMTVEAYEELA